MGDTIPSNKNEIEMFFHCGLCLKELPSGVSPSEYARLNVGFSPLGMQVWCERHDCNVCHIDFQGQTHPANTTRKG